MEGWRAASVSRADHQRHDDSAPGATGKSATQPAFDTEGDVLWLGLPALADGQLIRERVQRWLHVQALEIFGERLPGYAAKLGVEFRAYGVVVCSYALGQLFQRRQDPPQTGG